MVARTAAPVVPDRKLKSSEKQLLHALLQGLDIGSALQPLFSQEFKGEFWSRPVLEGLVKDPARNVETALQNVQDEELRREVRAAVLEPFGPISNDQALDSVKRLYDGHLVQKIEEIRQQLRPYGSGPAPQELVRRLADLKAEQIRVAAFKA